LGKVRLYQQKNTQHKFGAQSCAPTAEMRAASAIFAHSAVKIGGS
jgi:hypothetical protein